MFFLPFCDFNEYDAYFPLIFPIDMEDSNPDFNFSGGYLYHFQKILLNFFNQTGESPEWDLPLSCATQR